VINTGVAKGCGPRTQNNLNADAARALSNGKKFGCTLITKGFCGVYAKTLVVFPTRDVSPFISEQYIHVVKDILCDMTSVSFFSRIHIRCSVDLGRPIFQF